MRLLKISSGLLLFGFTAYGCSGMSNDTCPQGGLEIMWEGQSFNLCAVGFGATSGMEDAFQPGQPQTVTTMSFMNEFGQLMPQDERPAQEGIPPDDVLITIAGAAEASYEPEQVMLSVRHPSGRFDHYPEVPGTDAVITISKFPEEVGRMIEGSFEAELRGEDGSERTTEGRFQVILDTLNDEGLATPSGETSSLNPWITDPSQQPEISGL